MLSSRYQKRLVAEGDARACFICYKPSTTVLLNEVPGADHFYICSTHLDDAAFAKLEESAASTEQKGAGGPPVPPKPAIEEEIAKLRKEWESIKGKSEGGGGVDLKGHDKSPVADTAGNEGIPSGEADAGRPRSRWFILNKQVLQMRQQLKRRQAQSRLTRQMLANPAHFPSVPSHVPGATRTAAGGMACPPVTPTPGPSNDEETPHVAPPPPPRLPPPSP